MKLSVLQRLGGIAIIIGAGLLSAWAICWTTLLPVQERSRDFSLLIQHPNWIWIATLAFIGVILMIFGFTAAYSRLYEKAGIAGFLGYIFIVVAYLFQAAKITWEVFIYPVIVSHGPSIPLFRDKILMLHPQVALFRLLAESTIFIGVVFFSRTLIQSKTFPASSGILLLCGALIYAVGPMIHIFVAIAGVLILSAGCFILGQKMLSGTQE
jgi:hypothetical protein